MDDGSWANRYTVSVYKQLTRPSELPSVSGRNV